MEVATSSYDIIYIYRTIGSQCAAAVYGFSYMLLTAVKCRCRFLMTPTSPSQPTGAKCVQHTRDLTDLACKHSFSPNHHRHQRPTDPTPPTHRPTHGGADLYIIIVQTCHLQRTSTPQRYCNTTTTVQSTTLTIIRRYIVVPLSLKHIIIIIVIIIHRGCN